MARKPTREKLMCQKLTARKKEERRAVTSPREILNPIRQLADETLNNSLVRKNSPRTVKIPKIAEGKRSAQGWVGEMPEFSKEPRKAAWMFMKSPSRPLFSG